MYQTQLNRSSAAIFVAGKERKRTTYTHTHTHTHTHTRTRNDNSNKLTNNKLNKRHHSNMDSPSSSAAVSHHCSSKW